MRAILQFFNIKVFVYPDRVEIRGTIPTQILTEPEPKNPDAITPIIKSASRKDNPTHGIPFFSSLLVKVRHEPTG